MLALAALDVGAVVLGRNIVRSLRLGSLGSGVSEIVHVSFPESVVSPAQLALAVVLGLLLTGCYRSGDHWKNPGRILAGVALAVLVVFYRDVWETPGLAVIGRAVTIGVFVGLTISTFRLVLGFLERRLPRPALTHRVLEIQGEGLPLPEGSLGRGWKSVV